MTCADAGLPCGSIKAQYYVTNMDRPTDAWVRPHFNLVNTTGVAVPLSELTLRYWYTEETPADQMMACDFAFIGCSNLVGTFSAVVPPRAGADEVFTLSFLAAAGDLAAGGETQEMGVRFSKSDFSNYDETNDYSFDDTLGSLTDWVRVTLYRNGVLVWGAEPP
jgi:hypothetical protein